MNLIWFIDLNVDECENGQMQELTAMAPGEKRKDASEEILKRLLEEEEARLWANEGYEERVLPGLAEREAREETEGHIQCPKCEIWICSPQGSKQPL